MVSIIASAAGESVQLCRVIRQMSRFFGGCNSLDLRSGSDLGMAKEGNTLTPKFDLNIANNVVIFGKSNFDALNNCRDRIFFVIPESKKVSFLSIRQFTGLLLVARL